MQRIINETDLFQLLLKENIDNSDYQYLFMLYQPIIGVTATNLYLTLVQEKNLTDRVNLDFNHIRLMLLLNINQVELLEAFKKLETYHLLISYYYPLKSTYIYELKKPLTANIFFANKNLKNTLINKIGTLQFERQKYYFSKFQPELTEDFINISYTSINSIEKHNEEKNIDGKISLQQLIKNLNKTEIIPNKINLLNTNNNQLKANLETSTTININTNNKTIINQTLSLMQEKSPEEYLIKLTKKPIELKLKNTLKLLNFNYQLNNAVINCLLEYAWFKNNKRIEPNYILKIAKTFHENKINDVSTALNHLKLAYQKSKNYSFSTKKKYQQDVLWTNDNYQINTNKATNEEDNLMSEKEITLILEEFDRH